MALDEKTVTIPSVDEVASIPSLETRQTGTIKEEDVPDIVSQVEFANRKAGLETDKSLLELNVRTDSFESIKSRTEEIYNMRLRELQQQQLSLNLSNPHNTVEDTAAFISEFQEKSKERKSFEEIALQSLEDNVVTESEWAEIKRQAPTEFESNKLLQEKALFAQNKFKEFEAEASDRGLLLKARDLGASILTVKDFIDGAYGAGTLTFNSRIDEFGKRYHAASSMEEAKEIFEDFKEEILLSHVLFQNKDLALRQLELGLFGTEDDLLLENIFSTIDLATMGLIRPFTNLLRGFRGTRMRMGDTSGVAREVAEEGGVDEVGDAVTKLKPIDYSELSLSEKTTEELRKNQAILDKAFSETFKFSDELFTSQDKLQELESVLKTAKSKAFKGDSLGAYKLRPDGKAEIEVYTQTGNPYTRKGDALKRLKKLGLEGTVEQTPQGGWIAKAEIELDDNNFIKGYKPKELLSVERWFRNVDSWVDPELVALGRVSEGKFGFLEDSVKKVYESTWKGLGKERETVSRILISQRESDEFLTSTGERRWMTPKEFASKYRRLTDKAPSEKAIKAFTTYRQLNDFMYAVDNKVILDNLNSQGFKKLKGSEFLPQGVNGKLSTPETAKRGKVYDAATGRTFLEGELTDDILRHSDVIRLDKGSIDSFISTNKMKDGPTDLILVPKGQVEFDDLDFFQIPYLAGGRRVYDSETVFIKQPSVGKYADGKKYRMRDKTLFTANTMREGTNFVERFNKGLSLVNALKAGRTVDDILPEFEKLDLGSWGEFNKKIEDMGLDPEIPIQAVRNRELATIGEDIASDFSDATPMIQSLGNRLNSRGDAVKSIDGSEDNILDPFEATAASFDTVANNASFSQYKQFSVDRFKTVFGKHLDVPENASLNSFLNAGVKTDKRSKKLENTVKGHQQFIKELIGYKTADDMKWQEKVESIVGAFSKDRFLGKINTGISSKREQKIVSSLKEPTAKIRNITFNAKLGLFNPASFIIQTLHAPVVMAIAPKHGIKSLTTYAPFRQALLIDDPRATDILNEKYNKVEGSLKDLGGLKEAVEQYKRLGFDNFGGRLAYLDAANGSNSLTGGRFSDVVEKGRFFFEEGEAISRITAFTTARRKWLDKTTKDTKGNLVNPTGKSADSPEAERWIANEAHRLLLGMSRVDMQQITKGGIKGMMTQFMSYPMRALDALTNDVFTKAEKGRMLLAYFGLYGTAGIPLVDSLSHYIESRNGEPLKSQEEKEFLEKLVSNGLIDAVMLEMFDVDSNISARGGIGAFLTEITKMFYSEPTLDLFGGAGLDTTSKGWDVFRDISRMYSTFTAPSVDDVAEASLLALGGQISTFSNAYKAYHAWNTGILYDSYGRKLTTGLSKNEIMAMILGFTPQTYEDLGIAFDKASFRKQVIKDGVEDVLILTRKYSESVDEETKAEIQSDLSARFLAFKNEGIADDIVRQVNREMKSEGTLENMIYRSQLTAKPEEKE